VKTQNTNRKHFFCIKFLHGVTLFTACETDPVIISQLMQKVYGERWGSSLRGFVGESSIPRCGRSFLSRFLSRCSSHIWLLVTLCLLWSASKPATLPQKTMVTQWLQYPQCPQCTKACLSMRDQKREIAFAMRD
jgi:hypothetical protein